MSEQENRISIDDEIAMVINTRYTISDQIAIIRQKDTKPEEYAKFFDFAEEVKAKVKASRKKEITE